MRVLWTVWTIKTGLWCLERVMSFCNIVIKQFWNETVLMSNWKPMFTIEDFIVFRADSRSPPPLSAGYWPTVAMSLHNLLHRALCCHQAVLTRCIQTLPRDAARTLHSPAEHFLQRQPFPFCQSRGIKNQNRKFRGQEDEWRTRNKTVLTYIAAAGIGMIGLAYAAVPLYRLYCQVSSTTCTASVLVLYPCVDPLLHYFSKDILAGTHTLSERFRVNTWV